MLDFVHFTELYLFFLSFSFHGIIFRHRKGGKTWTGNDLS